MDHTIMTAAAPGISGLQPVHPGAILREDVLPAVSLSKTQIARLLRISRQSLYDLLDEKQAVTAAMALRLGKLFGNSPEFWLRLQDQFDLRTQQEALASELEEIPTLELA